ncbi:hypothetical protein BN439_2841 [Erwinia amylovora Ea644]|nr:hypothetical protein BN439_2841 [Erwinia amylovora Ea644]CCP07948.1 hypothetical protein BN440_2936 [Erwinia amylovora MR1]
MQPLPANVSFTSPGADTRDSNDRNNSRHNNPHDDKAGQQHSQSA